jgi:hypothetical protein
MIESVVMRKCNVSYKQSKQIVAMARDFLRLSPDSNLLWSKELENACILVYNSTNSEESVDAVATKRASSAIRCVQKTKSSSNMKREQLERPVTKERKARSLSKSRTRKTSKSPTTNSENADPQSGSRRTSEPASASISHRRSSSIVRRLDDVSNSDDLIKSARNVQRLGESKDIRSTRPQRIVSEKSHNSKMSDRPQASKSPSSSSSQKSKTRTVRQMDDSIPGSLQKDAGHPISASQRLSIWGCEKQSRRTVSSRSTVPEVSRRPRNNSESSTEREKQSRKSSRKSSSTLTDGGHPDMEQDCKTVSQVRRFQQGPEATNTSDNSVRTFSYPESQSSRSTLPKNASSWIKLNQNDSVAMETRSHHQSSSQRPDSKLSSSNLTFKYLTEEAKAKVKRLDGNEESRVPSLPVFSGISQTKSRRTESKFLVSDDDSRSGSIVCPSKPSIFRKIQTAAESRSSTPVVRRPRSPEPRRNGANSDSDKSNHSIQVEHLERHYTDKRSSQMDRKLNRKSLSPAPEQRTTKKDQTSSSSPKSLARLLSAKSSSVSTNASTTKKSAVCRRRLSMEELAKACEADPGLRDAIVANFGRDSGGIRLGTYRAASKVGGNDEFMKSFEEWEEHNDDSSESTNTPSKSPALQQYTRENPLSTFIGRVSYKSDSNKDENTVSTGSGSSTKSKTRMIPVMKGSISPAKRSFPKCGTTEPSSVHPTRIVKKTSHISLMSTNFEDPFIAKKNETPKSRNRRFGGENSIVVAPKALKVAGCSVGESVFSHTSNTTESTSSNSKDDSEEDIPIIDYTVPSIHDEYSEDQIFPEFSERFAKNNALKRKESVRVASRTDLSVSSKEEANSPLSTKKSSSSRSSLGPPRLPQRKLSIASSVR